MMGWGTFSGSLLFALLAGLASAVYLSTGAPSGAGALVLAVFYLVATAPTTARALRIGIVASLLGLVVGLLAPSTEASIVGAAFLLGVLRTGFVYRARPLRGLAIEGFLLSAGLLLAMVLNGYGPLDRALAVWGFFVVQSSYFLIGGFELRVSVADGIDPFVKARDEALRLMEESQA